MRSPELKVEGTVTEVASSGAKVQISPPDECSGCGACPAGEKRIIEIELSERIKPGDRLSFSVNCATLSKISFLVYYCPSVSAISGFTIGYFLLGNLGGFLSALAALSVSFLVLKVKMPHKYKDPVRITLEDEAEN